MDLRVRLFAYLSCFSLLLLALACLVLTISLRQDVAEEIEASTRLVEIMLSVSEARQGETGALKRLIEGDRLRHVALFIERSGREQQPSSEPSGLFQSLLARLSLSGPDTAHERRVRVGDDTLLIRTDPRGEIREKLRDAARVLGTLLLFSLGTMLVAWYAAHRALKPVRAFEDGLERLARGEKKATLPSFELKEFRRIASAIDRLATSLADSRAAERRLTQRLMALQEAERRELARELHDEFGQSLTAIGVAAAFVERHADTAASATLVECAKDIRAEAAKVSSHVRGMLSQLRPHSLDGLGITDALRELIDNYRQRTPAIEMEVSLSSALPSLPSVCGLALYRTLQEALTNVLRHSGARQVSVTLKAAKEQVVLTVADNGCGRAETLLRHSGGGLPGMFERARMARGKLRLIDAPGGGICIELSVPTSNKGENEDD